MTNSSPTVQPEPILYFDTNILSWIARGEIRDFIPELKKSGTVLVVSDVCISELLEGDPCKEVEILKRYGFSLVYAHAALFRGESFPTYPFSDQHLRKEESSKSELFLHEFFLSFSGRSGTVNIAELLGGSIEEVLKELYEDLPPDTDRRIVAALEKGRAITLESLAQAQSIPNPIFSKADLRSLHIGPEFMSYISPPKIVEKIIQKVGPELQATLSEAFREIGPSENIRERIQIACAFLTLIGFNRDKRVGNTNPSKSTLGVRSQFNDYYHIAAAVCSNAFITADSRCAKLAYAVYEAFNISTFVVLVERRDDQTTLSWINEQYWP